MDEMKKRVRRTTEEIAQEIDTKIAYHEKCIENLKKKKERTLMSKTRKSAIKELVKKAQAQGMSAEEIAEKLGIKF